MFEAFANAAAFGLLGLDPASRTGAAVQFFIMDVVKIFVLLFVGVLAYVFLGLRDQDKVDEIAANSAPPRRAQNK